MPTVTIVTHIFEHAARAQARALGLPDLRLVVVPHPINGKTESELRALAETAFSGLREAWNLGAGRATE